jgi:hypothetical protein
MLHEILDGPAGAQVYVWQNLSTTAFHAQIFVGTSWIHHEWQPKDYPGLRFILELAQDFVEEYYGDADDSISIGSADSATTIDSQDSAYDPTYTPSLEDMDVDDTSDDSLSSDEEDYF